MNNNYLFGILDFIKQAEQLKNTVRSGITSNGRIESVAEHSWRLCLLGMTLEQYYPQIDTAKLLKICIIHDLGEAINGDIPAIAQQPDTGKSSQERHDLQLLLKPLNQPQQEEFLALWDEYEAAASPEAKLAKALDKIETLLQHTQGECPEKINYAFNLDYGRDYTDYDALTAELRALIDLETASIINK